MAPKNNKNSDIHWLLLVSVLGYALVHMTRPVISSAVISPLIATLFCGLIVGYIRPERSWRWGIAGVLLVPVGNIVSGRIFLIIVTLPLLLSMILPGIAGSYLGSLLRKGFPIAGSAVQKVLPGLMVLILGIGGCLIPLLIIKPANSDIFIIWMIFTFILAGILGLKLSDREWRWSIVIGLGPFIATFINVLIDVSRDTSSHNLFPFELLFALVIGGLFGFIGTYTGMLIQKVLMR